MAKGIYERQLLENVSYPTKIIKIGKVLPLKISWVILGLPKSTVYGLAHLGVKRKTHWDYWAHEMWVRYGLCST